MSFFDDQVRAWSNPPVDDVGYIPSTHLLSLPDKELVNVISQMRFVRYSEAAWRNWNGGWRAGLRLNSTHDKTVLDFGCGVGMEATEIAGSGNRVILADISETNIELATRVMGLFGYTPLESWLLGEDLEAPHLRPDVDVIHCAGVLHHIPDARKVVEWFASILEPGGEVRLMVYSDRGWRTYVGTEPPTDTVNDPLFNHFVRTFDQVGQYAEWYNEYKIEALVEPLFKIIDFRYITVDDRYCTAVLQKR